jgi:hypothetical protein
MQESVASLKTTIPLAFKMVFLNPLYIVIAVAVFVTFWMIFNVFDQLLYFSPVVTFYLPDDAVTGFVITNITSVLMGILVAMNVYVIRNSKLKLDRSLQDETTYEKFTYSTLILVASRKNIHMGKMRLMSRPNTFIIFI